MIIQQAIEFLRTDMGTAWEQIAFREVRIGVHLTAVMLSDGSAGVASTIKNDSGHCRKEDRDFGVFTPLQIAGERVSTLFEQEKEKPFADSLKIATLNSLSARRIRDGKHRLHYDKDPLDLLDLEGKKNIVMVGAFQSYIRKLSETSARLQVLEFNEDALSEAHRHLFVPAGEASRLIPEADVVILTGMTLVNRTMEDILGLVSGSRQVMVTGPSSSIVPDVLFRHNIDVIGATLVTHPRRLLDLAAQGGAGYHLFHYCARKLAITRG